MAQSFSLALGNSILNYIFDGVAMPAAPASIFLSLHSANPERIGLFEAGNAGDTRLNVSALFTPDADDTVIANSADIVFPPAIGSYTATFWGLWQSGVSTDAADFLAQGQLDAPIVVTAGKTVTFLVGELIIGIL